MAKTSRVVLYSSSDRRWLLVEFARALVAYRRVTFHRWIHLAAAGFGLVVWRVAPGRLRWPAGATVAVSPWLWMAASGFRAGSRRHTVVGLRAVVAPRRATAERRRRFEAHLGVVSFPVYGVDGPDPRRIVAWSDPMDDELTLLGLAHGERGGNGRFVIVETHRLGPGDHPEHYRPDLEMKLADLHSPPAPLQEGGSGEAWFRAATEHRIAVTSAPAPEWHGGALAIEGRPHDAEVARRGDCFAARLVVGGLLVTVLARGVSTADLDLRPVDPRTYRSPW